MNEKFEHRKNELLQMLCNVEEDCKLLLERIPKYKEQLEKVQTNEDTKNFDKFCDENDIEKGLNYIKLF